MLNTEPEHFDVFLCHNSADKPEIRRIAEQLKEHGIRPWLDERDIRPGTCDLWALEEQIASIGSAAIFFGESGIGPWQKLEIPAFVKELVERECTVIPVILSSAKSAFILPRFLQILFYVDFRESDQDPLGKLLWGITGDKSKHRPSWHSQDPALFPEKAKQLIEVKIHGDFDSFSADDRDNFLRGVIDMANIKGGINITASRPGCVRLFLELSPEDADKIYAAAQQGQLELLGISKARLYPSLADPPDAEQRSQLLILLNRVNEFWIDGVLKQSLHHEVLISLDKRPMEDAVAPPWNSSVELPKQRQQLMLPDTRIETVFDATGLLLILGEPGSGKTTTLLELASVLMSRAGDDNNERVPFVLNLSSWRKKQTLVEWMAERLSNVYSIPAKLARRWLENDYLVPLLDGLDEVQADIRPHCVAAINAYLNEDNVHGLVVCCRLLDYQALPERLKLNGAFCIEPLNNAQIDGYFSALGEAFTSLRLAIKADPVMQELAESPLMLSIMSLTYRSAHPEQIANAGFSVETRQEQILNAYVDAVFLRKGRQTLSFPKQKTLDWLGCLATKMTEQSQSVFLVENLQPGWLDSPKQKAIYGGVSLLIFGLLSGLILALVIEFFLKSEPSVDYGFALIKIAGMGGVIGGVIGAIGGMLIGDKTFSEVGLNRLDAIENVETMGWSWELFYKQISNDSSKFAMCMGAVGVLAYFGFYLIAIPLYLTTVFFFIIDFVDKIRVDTARRPNEMQGLATGSQIFSAVFLIPIAICLLIGEAYGLVNKGVLIGWSTIWLCVVLVIAVIQGFESKIKNDKTQPNQGISLSIKNGVGVFLITFLAFGLIGVIVDDLIYGMDAIRYVNMILGLIFGVTLGLKAGLGAVIKHYSLRLALGLSERLPFKLILFLNFCAKLILLKKVGGGYIFIHRILLEHFAKLRATS